MNLKALRIAIPRYVWGGLVGVGINYAVQQKAMTPDQANLLIGVLSAFGVDLMAKSRADRKKANSFLE